MTATHGYLDKTRPLWLLTWPIWALVLFAALAAMRALPAGYARAVLVVPIFFLVPGSLTVCAAFGKRIRPQGTVFVGYAALLSVLSSAFISLALYMLHIPITAASTYWSLLGLCAVLASVAEARLIAERRHVGRRAAHNPEPPERESVGVSDDSGASRRGMWYVPLLAVVAGVSLLACGVYFYDHLAHPTPAGYTQLAWTTTEGKAAIAVGPSGVKLHFNIIHQQATEARFRLSATWEGVSARPLVKPLSFSIGPDKTFRGSLLVPPLPARCTYRIIITLVAIGQVDPLTKQQPTWSINTNVHTSGKTQSACAR